MKHICAKHRRVYSDRCPLCKKTDESRHKNYDRHKRDIDSAKFYHSAEWKRVRSFVLKRNPLCVSCGKPAQLVDHIIPIKQGGGKLDIDNLQPMCWGCHNAKTHREGRS